MPYLKNKESGEPLKFVIKRVVESDFLRIRDSKQFFFNWKEEEKNEVYKIYLVGGDKEILGMMSLIDHPDEYRIHLNLIEIRESQQGKNKTIEKIAGCLIAFACQLAFARGYDGFVSLKPKSKLVALYQNRYGFRQYGRLLGIEQRGANALINKYLADEQE